MPPRPESTAPAHSTRSASRRKASAVGDASSQSKSRKPTRAASTAKKAANRALESRVSKPCSRKPVSKTRSRSCNSRQVGLKPADDLDPDQADEDDGHDVRKVGNNDHPAPPPLRKHDGWSWVWIPSGQTPPAQMPWQQNSSFHPSSFPQQPSSPPQAPPPFTPYPDTQAGPSGFLSDSQACALNRDRHTSSASPNKHVPSASNDGHIKDGWDVTCMSPAAARYLQQASVPITRTSSKTRVNSYLEFCAMRGIHPTAPTAPIILIEWCVYLADTRKLSYETIKSYLAAVRADHIAKGVTKIAVFQHPVLQHVIQGIQRTQLKGLENWYTY